MSSKKYDFNGKVALVTGSSSGIGAAIAIQLAQYGASVTITGRNSAELAKVGEDVKKASGKEPLQLVGDLLEPGFITKLVKETVAKFGQLDFLVNNAGGATQHGKYDDAKMLDDFDKVMQLNTRSVVELTQLSIPHLEKTKGNIVNISSVAAFKPFLLTYCTSKAALDMVTKCSAQELGPKGIRVNSVNPGRVRSNLARSTGREVNYDSSISKSPIKRVGDPIDIAHMVSFLVSDDASNITGLLMVNDSGIMVE